MTDVTVRKPKSLQQHLKKSADKDLYAHVTKVMSHIVKHCPHKAMEDLEEISYLIKNEGKAVEHGDGSQGELLLFGSLIRRCLLLIKFGLIKVILTLKVGHDLRSGQLKSLLEHNTVGINLGIGLKYQ